MVIDTQKENLCVNKLVTKKKEIIFVEGDMIVPDSKPDILSTICTSGVISIYKKELSEGKLRIEGNINAYVMYLPEDSNEKIRGLNPTLDFSESINIPNCNENMNLRMNSNIKSIECKVVNGRKITIKAAIEVNCKVYSNEEMEVINNVANNDNIKMLKQDLKVNSLLGMEENKIYAKENIAIDNIDNLAEILKANVKICNQDVKVSYNKVLTKAEAEFKIMYLTEDNRINLVTSNIPVVGFSDIPNVTDNNICDVDYQIKNLILKPNSVEEHSIYVEMEVSTLCMVYEEKNINLIQDLYSPCENIEFNRKTVNTITDKCNKKDIAQIKEKVNIPNMENKKIIDVDIMPTINKKENTNSTIILEGEISMKFVLINNEDMQVDTQNVNLPFEYQVDAKNADLNTSTKIDVKSQNFIVQDNGDVMCNVDLLMDTDLYKNTSLNVINEIEDNGPREEQDYNVVMYIVKKDDTLWKIAKRFGTTIEDIVKVNGIEDENKIYPNQKLYIPRYVKKQSEKENLISNYA